MPRRLFVSWPERDGFTEIEFKAAMERLFADGRIRVETYGRKHDERQRIVAVDTATEEEK